MADVTQPNQSGAGPAAVFVHGLATSGALWRHVIEQVDGTTDVRALLFMGD